MPTHDFHLIKHERILTSKEIENIFAIAYIYFGIGITQQVCVYNSNNNDHSVE